MFDNTTKRKEENLAPLPKASPEKESFLGSSLEIKGDLIGEESMQIAGFVEGKVSSKKTVTLLEAGQVKGDIDARSIRIEGQAKGNLSAKEKITICESGDVRAELVAPQVVLEDGCQFTGTVEALGYSETPKTESQPLVNQKVDSKTQSADEQSVMVR